MSPESNGAHFMAVRRRNTLHARNIKMCLFFFSGRFENCLQNLRVFSEISVFAYCHGNKKRLNKLLLQKNPFP